MNNKNIYIVTCMINFLFSLEKSLFVMAHIQIEQVSYNSGSDLGSNPGLAVNPGKFLAFGILFIFVLCKYRA